MRIQHLTPAAVLSSLRSTRGGLSTDDAASRLREFGPNAVERLPRAPLPVQFAREFVHLFAIILWIAAALAFAADVLQPGQGMATLGWAVIGVIGYRVFHSGGSAAPTEVTTLLPKGARIVSTAVSEDRLVVTVDLQGAIEVRTFDLQTLRPAGRLRFATEP